MMDDLISRKEVIKAVDRHTRDDGTLDDDISVILEEIKTAFDKEKVIEVLKTRRDWHDINETPKNPRDMREICEIRERKGKWLAYNEAIEIIRKAGLNERNIIPSKAEE